MIVKKWKNCVKVITYIEFFEHDNSMQNCNSLSEMYIETKLGKMLAISDDDYIYILEFFDRKNLKKRVEKLKTITKSNIRYGITKPIESIKFELRSYFNGSLREFKTPYRLFGTEFQKRVWSELINNVSYGQLKSYADQSKAIGMPLAYRAVANANGANQLAILVPCHRIINSNGSIGGYGGGVSKKHWLINLERERLSK